jgi:hypothetical protein
MSILTLKKNVALAVESVMMNNSKEDIIKFHIDRDEWTGEWSPLNSLTLDYLVRAVYIGYEIEKTPEEKVKELYDSYGPSRHGKREPSDERVRMGIKLTLNTLGMKVEGINDDNN